MPRPFSLSPGKEIKLLALEKLEGNSRSSTRDGIMKSYGIQTNFSENISHSKIKLLLISLLWQGLAFFQKVWLSCVGFIFSFFPQPFHSCTLFSKKHKGSSAPLLPGFQSVLRKCSVQKEMCQPLWATPSSWVSLKTSLQPTGAQLITPYSSLHSYCQASVKNWVMWVTFKMHFVKIQLLPQLL